MIISCLLIGVGILIIFLGIGFVISCGIHQPLMLHCMWFALAMIFLSGGCSRIVKLHYSQETQQKL